MADLATTGPTSQAAPARLDPYSLRKDFPILATSNRFGKPLVYLDSAATSLKPLAVIEAVDGYNREYSSNTSTAASTRSRSARPKPMKRRASKSLA
jgi:Selenocysteine lyase